MTSTRPKVLFVDDEPSLRLTIPLILQQRGFEVVVAGDVTSAIEQITRQPFDVLLSDLNMEELSDGFTIVSAMRKLQPKCRTLILTGYPDFQGALDRLLGHADGYILKPTRPDALADRILQQMEGPEHRKPGKHRKLAELLQERRQKLLDRWSENAGRDAILTRARGPQTEHLNRPPEILDEVISALQSHRGAVQDDHQLRERALEAARKHGVLRFRQGYTLEQLFREVRILQCCMFELAQENLLELDVSVIIPDLTLATDTIEVLAGASIKAFVDAERAHTAESIHSVA